MKRRSVTPSHPESTRGERPVWLLAGLFAVQLVSAACTERPEKAPNAGAPSAVPVEKVSRTNLVKTLNIASEFRAFQEVELHAKVSGYVQKINVDIGDHVKAGDVIAVLDVPELKQDLARSQATRLRAAESLKRIDAEIERAKALEKQAKTTSERLASANQQSPNSVAQDVIDTAQSEALAASAEVSAKRAALVEAQQSLEEAKATAKRVATLIDYATITAPFDGVVTKRFADTGAMIEQVGGKAGAIVSISQVDPLRLSFPVPESVIPAIHPGLKVQVSVEALHKTLSAEVWRSSGSADDATRTMETQVLIPNPDFEIKPGMVASLRLTLAARQNVLAVPVGAVSDLDQHPQVLVVDHDHKLERRSISIGLQTTSECEVTSGLTEGALVVVGNVSSFSPGQVVTPKLVEDKLANHTGAER